jgi:hypothetical protein
MKIEIKKTTTEHENVSKREIAFDIYVNGEYRTTFKDINDALDFGRELK